MGQSTNGQLCYGIVFEEGFEFPWSDEKYDDNPEEWWREVKGYANPEFYPFTEEGDYKDGVTEDDDRIGAYYDYERKWMLENPFPIEIVNYCSCDCQMYILAIPDTFKNANRGCPTIINPADLIVKEEEEKDLIDFCKKHDIDLNGNKPGWWLSSLWC